MNYENKKDELNALMDLEIARREAIHYIEMDTDTFAVSKGVIEIRRIKMKKLKSFMIFFNTIVAVACIGASICLMVKGSSSENVLLLLIMAKLLMIEVDIWGDK